MVHSYFYNGRFAEALEFSEARLKTFSNYLTLDSHGFLLLNIHRYEEAIVYFNKAIAVEGIRYPRMLGWMGAAYARLGEKQCARKIIEELKERLARHDKGSIAFFIAIIYAALLEKTSALAWLQTACDAHDMEMLWLMTEPQLYHLHEEAEFRRLAGKVGFRIRNSGSYQLNMPDPQS
jgi:tetratricopeptide (TPR) repeat protein